MRVKERVYTCRVELSQLPTTESQYSPFSVIQRDSRDQLLPRNLYPIKTNFNRPRNPRHQTLPRRIHSLPSTNNRTPAPSLRNWLSVPLRTMNMRDDGMPSA